MKKTLNIGLIFTFYVKPEMKDFVTHIPLRIKGSLGENATIYVIYFGSLNEERLRKDGITPCRVNIDFLEKLPGAVSNFLRVYVLKYFLPFVSFYYAKKMKIDIFMNPNNHRFFSYVTFGARLAGSKAIARIEGNLFPGQCENWKDRIRKFMIILSERLSLSSANNVIVISHYLKDVIMERRHKSEKKIFIISPGIDVHNLHMKSPEKLISTPKRLLYVGRIKSTKGIEFAIRAFIEIKKYYPNMVFNICGLGEQEDELKAKYQNVEGLNFLGYVPNDELPEIYRDSDIFILPTLFEALSLVTLESMASGVPVIASRVGELPLLLDHGARGILVEPGNSDQIVEGIKKFIEDNEYRLSCIKNARQYVEENHSFEALRDKYFDLFNETLNG